MILKWLWISILAIGTMLLIRLLNIHFILAPIFVLAHLGLMVCFKFYRAFEVNFSKKILSFLLVLPALTYTISMLIIKANGLEADEAITLFNHQIRDELLMPILLITELPVIYLIVTTGKLRA